MLVAGMDLSSRQIDVCLLDVETDTATHHRRRLDTRPGKQLDRIRRVRDALPTRGAWADAGCVLAAIEEPFSRQSMSGQVPILMVIGAILSTLPTDIPVALLRADDWRRGCNLPLRGARPDLKRASVGFARSRWRNAPDILDDNAAEAWCIAYAGRELWDAAEKERRTAA